MKRGGAGTVTAVANVAAALKESGVPLIADGGLATALEARGYSLHPRLWSAGVFLEQPEAVEALRREMDAGLASKNARLDTLGIDGYLDSMGK